MTRVASAVAALRARLPRDVAVKLHTGAEMARARAAEKLETPAPIRIPGLDRLLGGGLPRGNMVEIVARLSAGRFSAILSALAAMTGSGEAAALVDLGHHFDCAAAVAAGADLERLLWIRPRWLGQAAASAEIALGAGFALVVLDLGMPPVPGRRLPEAVWPRLARAAAAHRGALLVTSPYRVAGTAASAVVGLDAARGKWQEGGSPPLLAGAAGRAFLVKRRGERPGTVAALTFVLEEAFEGGRPVRTSMVSRVSRAASMDSRAEGAR